MYWKLQRNVNIFLKFYNNFNYIVNYNYINYIVLYFFVYLIDDSWISTIYESYAVFEKAEYNHN